MNTKLFLIIFLASFKLLHAQSWSSGTPLLKDVRGGNIASYSKNKEGYLFIVSGREEKGMVKTVQRYNVNTNMWDTLNPHPTGLLGAATTVLGDNLYIIGGVINPPGFGQTEVSKFNITHNLWSTVAPFPYAIVDAKAVAYQDSLIYVAGGSFEGPDSARVLLYNANSDTWRSATPIPSPTGRNFGGFAITGNKITYMCGTNWFGSPEFYNSVYVGTINSNNRSVIEWKESTNFPGKTRSFFDAHNWVNNSIIMTGGSTDNTFNTWSDECYTFNPNTAIWTKLPDKPTAWLTGQSGVVQLPNHTWKLVCAGGYNGNFLHVNEILTTSDEATTIKTLTDNDNNIQLHQNFPNPFGAITQISYQLNSSGLVTLEIYDALGTVIKTLVHEKNDAGSYFLDFDAATLAVGIYYCKLSAAGFSTIIKMSCIR